jgi:hypothetical protein
MRKLGCTGNKYKEYSICQMNFIVTFRKITTLNASSDTNSAAFSPFRQH